MLYAKHITIIKLEKLTLYFYTNLCFIQSNKLIMSKEDFVMF